MDTHYLIGLMLFLTMLQGSEQQQGPLLVIQRRTIWHCILTLYFDILQLIYRF